MNINELNDTIKKKISEGILLMKFLLRIKTYLHLKHKNFQKNKFHLKIFIKSNHFLAMNKIDSTKKIYQILDLELKKYIHSIQIDFNNLIKKIFNFFNIKFFY